VHSVTGRAAGGLGATINESIANAESCLAKAPEHSCARRTARLQAVFAWCERTIHSGAAARADFQKLGNHVALLTGEFGDELAAAVWCQNAQAQAEPVRLRLQRE
jgi:hypothetical protein